MKMMDHASAPADAHPVPAGDGAGRRRLGLGLLFLLVAGGCAWFLATHLSNAAGDSDTSGYLNSARLIDRGQTFAPVRPIRGVHRPEWNTYFQVPLGFSMADNEDRMVPTYPAGMPLQLFAAAKLVGWHNCVLVVNLTVVLLSGWLMMALGRQCGLARAWAWAGTALLWACPLFVFLALLPMSDLSAMLWCMAALWAAGKSEARRTWSMLAGAAVGMAVLVRPTDALILVPLLVLLRRDPKRWLGLLLGGLPFAVFFLVYNQQHYGSPFLTGYGDVSDMFRTAFFTHNLGHFGKWLLILGTPLVLLAPALPWLRHIPRRTRWSLALWFTTFTGFYVFYYYSGLTWWFLRFIIPALPALILASLLVAQTLWARLPAGVWRTVPAALLIGSALLAEAGWNQRLETLHQRRNNAVYPETAQWLRDHLPPDAVIVGMQMSGALQYYTPFPLVRYDIISAASRAEITAAARSAHLPVYAALFPFEIKPVVGARFMGTWTRVAEFGAATIWQLHPAETAGADHN
jgi:hypothetical protein